MKGTRFGLAVVLAGMMLSAGCIGREPAPASGGVDVSPFHEGAGTEGDASGLEGSAFTPLAPAPPAPADAAPPPPPAPPARPPFVEDAHPASADGDGSLSEESSSHAPGGRPVRFGAGDDASPTRLSPRVPSYVLAEDGSTVEAQVVAVSGATLAIASLLTVRNLDTRERTVAFSASPVGVVGVLEARFDLYASGEVVLASLDLLAAQPYAGLILPAGSVLHGRYVVTLAEGASEGFSVAFRLDVAA